MRRKPATNARKSTDVVQLKLRFQEQLRRVLEREARKTGRSLNGEIVCRLIDSFQQQSQHEVVTAAIKQTVRETLQQLSLDDCYDLREKHPLNASKSDD